MMYSIILFIIFALIFISTAIITLLGIINKISIRDKYLSKLFAALILEVIVCIISLFKLEILTPYKVWNITGYVTLSENNKIEEFGNISVSILPNPQVDGTGKFDFFIAVENKLGTWRFPEIRFNHPKYDSVSIDLERKQNNYDLHKSQFSPVITISNLTLKKSEEINQLPQNYNSNKGVRLQ